ncbi:MAG: hypothetical protein ACRYGP_32735 [Janthinobacterium lividum]
MKLPVCRRIRTKGDVGRRTAEASRILKLLRSPEFTLVASATMVASVTAFAYSQLGFVGVILVGLIILFMAVQSELQKDGMVRPIITERTTRME